MFKTGDAALCHCTLEEEVEAVTYSPRSVKRKEEREEETAIGFLLVGCRAKPAWIMIDGLERPWEKRLLVTTTSQVEPHLFDAGDSLPAPPHEEKPAQPVHPEEREARLEGRGSLLVAPLPGLWSGRMGGRVPRRQPGRSGLTVNFVPHRSTRVVTAPAGLCPVPCFTTAPAILRPM